MERAASGAAAALGGVTWAVFHVSLALAQKSTPLDDDTHAGLRRARTQAQGARLPERHGTRIAARSFVKEHATERGRLTELRLVAMLRLV